MKKNIRQEILDEALVMFNDLGIDQTTTRNLVKRLNISLGNLTYYFPTKTDIIHTLCLNFIDEVDAAIRSFLAQPQENSLLSFYSIAKLMFEVQIKYKFILENRYAEIIVGIPEIQKHYQNVFRLRFDAEHYFHEQLIKDGFFKKDIREETDAIVYVINILVCFWHQENAIYSPDLSDKEKVERALAILFQIFKPYLTEKGEATINPLLTKLNRYEPENFVNK